jgi:small subunit ribosomal protein S19e
MVTLYDAPTEELLDAVADELRDEVDEPDWRPFAKAGSYAELPPEQEDFFYTRAASVLRTVAIDGPVGVERLRTRYGGKSSGSTRYRVAPEHRVDGSGSLIRTILQELGDAGLVERPPDGKGRVVTAEGRSLLDATAGDVLSELDRPELERYV